MKFTLHKGVDYVVIYDDCHDNETKMAGAKWGGDDFIYCDGKFTIASVKPNFKQPTERVPACHIIVGWIRLPEQRLSEEDKESASKIGMLADQFESCVDYTVNYCKSSGDSFNDNTAVITPRGVPNPTIGTLKKWIEILRGE